MTLVDALTHICGAMLRVETSEANPTTGPASNDLATVIAQDEAITRQEREHAALALDVAEVLLEAIEDGRLKVEGVPTYELELWRSRIGILDWQSGRFTLAGPEIPVTLRQFYTPSVRLDEAVALFEERPEQESEQRPAQVSAAALRAFVEETMRADRLTEAAAKDRAQRHFDPAHFTARQWSEAWRNAPNKRQRGEKAASKPDA